MVAINFSGEGAAESATITVGAGEVIRARFSEFVASKLRLRIVANSVTTFVEVDDEECWIAPALTGDVVSLVYDGQGNPGAKVTGLLEAITL